MNLLLLSGESISNKAWIENIEVTLRDQFATTKILHYDHWANGGDTIDLQVEYSKLISLANKMSDYAIFAKSIGTVLSVRGIFEKKLIPVKCVFVGAALLVGERNIPEFPIWMEGFSVPTLFITKTFDPVAPADKLRDLLVRYHVQNYQFIEITGDNHKYDNLEEIKGLITNFI